MATFGFSEEDYRPPDIEVWPENMATVDAFVAMRTQWRFSHYGATGLDYGVLPVVLRMVGVPRADWTDVFEGIRVMEGVELISLRHKQAQEDAVDE